MNDQTTLSAELRDAFQEITNIGMGRAGYALARVLGTFVELSIPRVQMVSAQDFIPTASGLIGLDDKLVAIHQSFFGRWKGETITIFNQSSCDEVAALLGYSQQDNKYSHTELQLDIGNILSGACLNGIAEVLGVELHYNHPGVLAENVHKDRLFAHAPSHWQQALLTEVNFALEHKTFKSHLLILLTSESLANLQTDIEKFMAQY
ncbi:MAG: hypothetical protein OEW58_11710 [Gammaproteobacteria bacterium]|nr:hypothetical protein [Gammaproteobacteria bacterium]